MSAVRMSGFGVGGFKTVLGTGGVCLQPFAMGEGGGNAPECLSAGLRHFDQAGALLEVVYAQGRGKPRRAGGGQYMVGPGTVIAERFRSVRPQERSEEHTSEL